MDPAREEARLELLARMLEDQRADDLASLDVYLDCLREDDAWIAERYLRLADPSGAPSASRKAVHALEAGDGVGPYILVERLGVGGQGTVWRALDQRLDRAVALKVLPVAPGAEDAGPRYRREAEIAARLDHPSLCSIYEVGSQADLSWIAMQLIEGEPLSEESVRPPWHTTVEGFRDLTGALRLIHGAGVIHRDIKPANIMRSRAGRLVLLDFGVARSDEASAPLTLTGQAMGTPAYMSPEQLRGDPALDGRSDVWSLGVSLYETLSGRRPFDAPTREGVVRQILESDPAPMQVGLPRDLETVLQMALAKEPDQRYADATALGDELDRVLTGRPVKARSVGWLGRMAAWSRREPVFAGSLLGFVVILLAMLTGLAVAFHRTRTVLAERNGLLDEVGRSADRLMVDRLLDEETRLWPAVPDRLEALSDWVQRANAVRGRAPEHVARRAKIAARLLEQADEDSADSQRDAWLLTELDELLDLIDGVELPLASVVERLRFAETVEERSLVEPAAAWEAARGRVSQDVRFTGFDLVPQIGLVPLGPDPSSGLEEFAHLASGSIPDREEGTGALRRAVDHGLVMVLVPGGTATLGCVLPGDEGSEGDPFVSAGAAPHEVGLLEASFQPYFVSKYEMTQVQWTRHTGENPAYYQFGEPDVIPRRPVEQVSLRDAQRVLAELGLRLPTEEEWEYAARSGSTAEWVFGNDRSNAGKFGNLCDSVAKAKWRNKQFGYEEWLDDGFADLAPVGSYRANAFGLHDVMGNVQEWTTSGWSWPEENYVNRFDDRDPETSATRVLRGGSFGMTLHQCRLAARRGFDANVRSYQVGVRAILEHVP